MQLYLTSIAPFPRIGVSLCILQLPHCVFLGIVASLVIMTIQYELHANVMDTTILSSIIWIVVVSPALCKLPHTEVQFYKQWQTGNWIHPTRGSSLISLEPIISSYSSTIFFSGNFTQCLVTDMVYSCNLPLSWIGNLFFFSQQKDDSNRITVSAPADPGGHPMTQNN